MSDANEHRRFSWCEANTEGLGTITNQLRSKEAAERGRSMRRGLMIAMFMEAALFFWLAAAPLVLAEWAVTGGSRPAGRSDVGTSMPSGSSQSIPAFFQEVVTAFTAAPTSGSVGTAANASRATFSTTETIEFDAVLFDSGTAGTTDTVQVCVFDPRGRLSGCSSPVRQSVPSDFRGPFIRLGPGALPVAALKWLMIIIDAFGNTFVTPFQDLVVQF